MARNYPIDMNLAGPVNDNSRSANMSHRVKPFGSAGKAGVSQKHMDAPKHHSTSHSPQATSLPGSLSIISNVMAHADVNRGIPGIIHSTTTSPETRSRLVAGIIASPMAGNAPQGPVSSVMGHDATAYNSGMVHLRGSPFSHPGGKMHEGKGEHKMMTKTAGKKLKKHVEA